MGAVITYYYLAEEDCTKFVSTVLSRVYYSLALVYTYSCHE